MCIFLTVKRHYNYFTGLPPSKSEQGAEPGSLRLPRELLQGGVRRGREGNPVAENRRGLREGPERKPFDPERQPQRDHRPAVPNDLRAKNRQEVRACHQRLRDPAEVRQEL